MKANETAVRAEFIVLVALLTAMVAMSIDAMLPALGDIARDLGAKSPNDRQLVLTVFFAGMTIGTLVYGPVSDSFGRKPTIFGGLAIYGVGALLCLFAASFPMLLWGRALQGLGAAGPRVVSLAMVRDGSSGAAMARVMSFVMSVFMLVPILAPSIGQAVLLAAGWRWIFVGLLAMASIAAIWLALRQAETLPSERRLPLSPKSIWQGTVEVVTTPVTFGYTLAVGAISGSFITYLATSQQIFADQYGQGKLFAVWFGVLAVGIALAIMLNAKLVMRHGMRALSKWALRASLILTLGFLALSAIFGGHPPLWTLGAWLFANFFCIGTLFGNYSAIAMEPMGRIAGIAAAVTGSLSLAVALGLGTAIGLLYDGTVIPLVAGFAFCGLAAFLLSEWAERRRG